MRSKILFFFAFYFFASCAYKSDIQFESAKHIGTPKAYKRFLNANPNSIYTEEALDLLEISEINNVIESKDNNEFNNFIQEYPNSPYLPELLKAKDELFVEQVFKEVKAKHTLKDYIDFIAKYPNTSLAKEVEKLIYQKRLEGDQDKLANGSNSEQNLEEQTFADDTNNSRLDVNIAKDSKYNKDNKYSTDNKDKLTKNKQIDNQNNTNSLLTSEYQSQIPTIRISNSVARAPTGRLEEQDYQIGDSKALQAGDKAILNETKSTRESIPKDIAPIPIPIAAESTTAIKPNSVNPNQVIEANPLFQQKQTPPQDFSYLIDESSISLQDSPENVLYGEIFSPSSSPRIIQADFTLFIQTLQRTNNYIRIKTRFHNLSKTKKKYQFTKVTLVNNIGRRVKPINVLGINWKLSESGIIKSEHSPNEISDLDFLFPALNLFNANSYKLYVTLNSRNYLIQIK